MTGSVSAGSAGDRAPFRATVLRQDDEHDQITLARIRQDPTVEVLDHATAMAKELRRLRIEPAESRAAELPRWVYYPWRRELVSVLGPALFRSLRLDRNRYKITEREQDVLATLSIGVVGLSVGHSVAYTLALEGLCGRLRLADFDTIELSNLNRIPTGISDIGLNKAISAARRIAELDPYLPVEVQPDGLTEANIDEFFDGLDLLIEESDSLDMKIRAREEARRRRIPVLMETSDRGLFDAEMFDEEPGRPILHGLLGEVDARTMRGLSTHDKAPHVMRILEPAELSARMAASMAEIDRSIDSWPQLAGDVALGAATVCAAIRRYARGELGSGRIRMDLDQQLEALRTPDTDAAMGIDGPRPADLTFEIPDGTVESIVHAVRLAPSGGNSQPWLIAVDGSSIAIRIDRSRPSTMDVADRGGYVAIGAATFNARVAAAHHGETARVVAFPEGMRSDVVVRIDVLPDPEPVLGDLYPSMVNRITNRGFGRRRRLPARLARSLAREVESEGARLVLLTDECLLIRAADVLAESDRIRYLTPDLHTSMFNELQWPGRDRLDVGIDVRTLDLNPSDLAKLEIAARDDVMALLAGWKRGQALGDSTRDRIVSSSALAAVTVRGHTDVDYLRGGAAVERMWIQAQRLGLAVHPVSPVFLYALDPGELAQLSAEFLPDLVHLKQIFGEILSLDADESIVLVLRLSNEAGSAVRSGRLPRDVTVQAADGRNTPSEG